MKRKRFRERKKAQKVEKWMEMRDKALQKRWRERSEQYKLDMEQEIRDKEIECSRKREALASALEKTAVNIRSTSTEVEKINDMFLEVATEIERSEAGTINLSACLSSTSDDLARKAQTYRDMAEHLKAENRRLRVENSEKVEAVRRFWDFKSGLPRE